MSPTPTLPVIDLSPFLPRPSDPSAQRATAKAINAACTDYGFFYLTGHGIPDTTLAQVLSLARDFFTLPLEEKNRIRRCNAGGPEGGDGARGYQGVGENVTGGRRDVHEAVDWYCAWGGGCDAVMSRLSRKKGGSAGRDEDEGEGNGKGEKKGKGGPPYATLQGPNLWPERPAEMRDVYLDYIERVKRVGTALVRAMGVALELGEAGSALRTGEETTETDNDEREDEEIFVRNTDQSFWVMRMIGYPPLPPPPSPSSSSPKGEDDANERTGDEGNENEKEEAESQFSCGAHTDYGCVTLLLADATPGALQVLSKSNTWIPADPLPSAFVVNIGDMMQLWTNGLWKSTVHRVLHRGEGYRVSVPFFFEPNFGAVVRPLGKCVERCGGVVSGGDEGGTVYGEHLLGKIGGNFYVSGGEK